MGGQCCKEIELNDYFVIQAPHLHDDVIKWKHFPRNWPFVRGIHRSPVNSQHKGQWRGALMFSLIGVWINSWVNNREAGDWRRYGVHYDVTVMIAVYLPSEYSDILLRTSSYEYYDMINTDRYMPRQSCSLFICATRHRKQYTSHT